MAYTIEVADVVIKTVGRFSSLNAYQLAGHVATIEFWQQQVKVALEAIDGYDVRQRARIRGQEQHIRQHDTRRFSREDMELHREFPDDPLEGLGKAVPDRYTIDKETLKAKRREVADSFYHFIRRCNAEGLLSKPAANQALDACGIGMEPGDFRD